MLGYARIIAFSTEKKLNEERRCSSKKKRKKKHLLKIISNILFHTHQLHQYKRAEILPSNVKRRSNK